MPPNPNGPHGSAASSSTSRADEPPLEEFARVIPRGVLGGVLMGLANLVPGISGGTMLLAVGIYPRFIEAGARVASFRVDRGTVVTLGTVVPAALAAIVLLAGPVKDLVVGYRWIMYALFIGLTLGGVPVILGLIRQARVGPDSELGRGGMILGAAAGFMAMAALAWLQIQGAGGDVNEGWLIFFLGGLAGAAAMILPGVSGGYLLLVLGAYVPILGAVEAFRDALSAADVGAVVSVGLQSILPVGLGVVLGIAVVSHALRWLFNRYRLPTLGVLLGLLVGAVAGLWPFQAARAPEAGELIKGQVVEVLDAPAPESPLDFEVRFVETGEPVDLEDLPTTFFSPSPGQSGLALLLIGFGFAVTVGISRLGTGPR